MNEDDIEFIQILNIIKRGQRLVIQAKASGIDTSKAEEYINEAKYALRVGNREAAIDYAKKCMLDVIQTKRERDKETLARGALEELTKAELRKKCQELGLDPMGLKQELVDRIRSKLATAEGGTVREQTKEGPPQIPDQGPLPSRNPGPEPAAQEIPGTMKIPSDIPAEREPFEESSAANKKIFDPEEETSNMITGLSYLVEEQRAEKIYHLYSSLKMRDKVGFAISRSNPKLLQRTYKIDVAEFMWLTDRDVGGEIRSVPPSLESIIYYIEEFIDRHPDGVILLDGLEYLIGNNTFNPVIRFLRRLVDKISTTQCILLVSLAPETLDQSQVTLLEKDLYPLNYSSAG